MPTIKKSEHQKKESKLNSATLALSKTMSILNKHWTSLIGLSIAFIWLVGYWGATNYYSSFSIDIKKIFEFTDYYLFVVRHPTTFIMSLAVIPNVVMLFYLLTEKTEKPVKKQTVTFIRVLSILASILAIFTFILITVTNKEDSYIIKNGLTERYNLSGKNFEEFCVSIIGNTGRYLFVWDFELAKPKLISHSQIQKINLAIRKKVKPPNIRIRNHSGMVTGPPAGTKLSDYYEDDLLLKWKFDFKLACKHLSYEKEILMLYTDKIKTVEKGHQ